MEPQTIEGDLNAEQLRFGIVASRFHGELAASLLDGAVNCLLRHGARPDAISVVRVPGAFEIPAAVQRLVDCGGVDAIVTLGVLIRGDTPHFDFISSAVTNGISRLSIECGLPVSFGVITCNTREQALERTGPKSGNKGWEAALAAIEMTNLFAQIRSSSGLPRFQSTTVR